MIERSTYGVVFITVVALCLACTAFAHKPLLAVDEEKDDTILLEAAFSNGASIAGSKIIIKNRKTGEVIERHTMDEQGMLRLKKPKVEYTITLQAGKGHTITAPGPPLRGHQSDKPKPQKGPSH